MARFRTAPKPQKPQKPRLKASVTSKITLFALGRHFSSSKIKSFFHWSLRGFTKVNEKLRRCYLDAAPSSPFLYRAHGDHTSPFSSLLPHWLLYSLTDNKTMLQPQLSTPLSPCLVYTEKQIPTSFEYISPINSFSWSAMSGNSAVGTYWPSIPE